VQSLILLDCRTVAVCASLVAINGVALAQDAQGSPGSTHVTVTCASQAGERRECAANTSAAVTLMKSTGAAACLLGLVGVNLYPTDVRNHPLKMQVIDVNRSPVSSTFGYYVGGQKGTTCRWRRLRRSNEPRAVLLI
jgi:hypothetical protein